MKKTIIWISIGLILFCSGNIFAQQKEIWQPPEPPGKWYRLEAGNFIVWYEEKDEAIAEEVARAGQSMYEDYKEVFGPKSPKKVHVHISGREGSSNGSYNHQPPRITLYPTAVPLDTKGYNWNYYLLSHELAHYMHLEYRGGLAGAARYVVGPIAGGLNFIMPLWGTEGIATSMEGAYTSMGRPHNPIFTMPYRADILLNNVESYEAIARKFDGDDDANYGKNYQYGVQIFEYLKRHYGYQEAAALWHRFANLPIGYQARFKKTTSLNFNLMYQDMIQESKEYYSIFNDWQRGENITGTPVPLDKELTRKERRELIAGSAVYSVVDSSESGALVYEATNGCYWLFNSNDSEKNDCLFSSDASFNDFFTGQPASITNDETKVAYVRPVINQDMLKDGMTPIGTYNDLFIYDVQSKTHTALTNKQQLTTPTITDDGKYVYATQHTRSGNFGRLIKIDVDTSKIGYEVIYEGEESMVFYKDVSPDGNKIVFVERGHLIGVELNILDMTTGEIITLLQRDYGAWISNPQFVDDNTITITADLEYIRDNSQLYLIDIANIQTQAPTWIRLAQDKVGFHSAVFDGQANVLYASHNSFGYSVYKYSYGELNNEIIDVTALPIPDFYQENDLLRYLNKSTIDDPESAQERRPISPTTPVEFKKRRALDALPTRPLYYYPMLAWGTLGLHATANIGFSGPTLQSSFSGKVGYIFDSNAIDYNLAYGYSFPRIGALRVETSREFKLIVDDTNAFSTSTNKVQDVYKHSIGFGRLIYQYEEYFQLAFQQVNSFFTRTNFRGEHEKEILGNSLSHSLVLQMRSPVGMVSPGVVYTPKLLDQEDHVWEINGSLAAGAPVLPWLALQLSNYTFWVSNDKYLDNVERFFRTQDLFNTGNILSGFGITDAVMSGKGSTGYPLQSSFAFDIQFPWMDPLWGVYWFEPQLFYTNLFVEQTLGYNIDEQIFGINKYLITGVETGLRVNIIEFPLDFRIGLSYKIPYDSSADAGSMLYIAIGPGAISQVAGIIKKPSDVFDKNTPSDYAEKHGHDH